VSQHGAPSLQESAIDTSDKALMIKRVSQQHPPNGRWSPEKKIEVVTKWLALGNLRLVSELTGVSYGLVRLWRIEPWWKDLEAEIKASRRIQTDTKLAKIVERSLETVADRLENGNFKYNRKTGEVDRIPISALEANKIASDMLTQQNILAKQEVLETTAQQAQSVQDTIKLLFNEFAKFNTKRTVEVVATEVTDAVHDQREEGLQEAVRPLRWETGEHSQEEPDQSSESSDGEGGSSPQGGWEGRGSQDPIVEGRCPDYSEQPEERVSQGQSFLLPQFGR
jgi:ribosomal protein S8E